MQMAPWLLPRGSEVSVFAVPQTLTKHCFLQLLRYDVVQGIGLRRVSNSRLNSRLASTPLPQPARAARGSGKSSLKLGTSAFFALAGLSYEGQWQYGPGPSRLRRLVDEHLHANACFSSRLRARNPRSPERQASSAELSTLLSTTTDHRV